VQLRPADLTPRESHALIISCIVPRPIAWVASRSAAGRDNLAPFSFFMGVSSDPPTLAIAVGRRRGAIKDTAANILETGSFIVHVVTESAGAAMVATSGDYAPEVDEFEVLGLDKLAGTTVDVPRLAGAPVAMECRLIEALEVGRGPTHLLVGEVQLFHVDDRLLRDGAVDVTALAPLGRLGGQQYAPVREVIEHQRPRLDERS